MAKTWFADLLLDEGVTMNGNAPNEPAVRLLADIAAAGYASLDHFIANLRVDPVADTVELSPVEDLWVIPPVRYDSADDLGW